MIDLTDVELFESLVGIESDNGFIDLHNNYDCTSVQYSVEKKLFEVFFQAANSNVVLQFKDAVISKFNLLPKRAEDSCTLNNFYRGRFEVNGELFEYSPARARYYYIEFEEGDTFEILAQQVFLFWKS